MPKPINLPEGQSRVLQQLVGIYQRGEIQALHDELDRLFAEYYTNANYSYREQTSLISTNDPSVLFTGAFISNLKDILLTGDYPKGMNGIHTRQACLRTQDFETVYDNSFVPFGQTFFNMVGILSRPGRFKEVTQEAIDFTINWLGTSRGNVKIKSTKLFDKLDTISETIGVSTEYDTEQHSYYQWHYGIPGVHGEGITICVFNPLSQSWWDVGNVVRIIDTLGNELGTEFGYGHEFFLSATLGIAEPLRLSKVFEVFPYEPGLPQKYYAYMEAVVRMKLAGATIGHHKTAHIYKQYLKGIYFIGSNIGKSITDVISDIETLATAIGQDKLELTGELAFLNLHDSRVKAFSDLVKRVGKYLWSTKNQQQPKELITDPAGMLNAYLQKNGLDPMEVRDQIERLNRFDISLES